MEASEWVTRRRRHGWPSKTLIDTVVEGGCHFLDVARKLSSEPDVEFSISFSKAENALVDSWNPSQRRIYGILHLMKTRMDEVRGKENTIICTYYFKTLMFWACEDQAPEFWNEDSMEQSLTRLVSQLIDWMSDKCCPNYFIPANNMMDHIPDCEELNLELNILAEYSQSLEVCTTDYHSLEWQHNCFNDSSLMGSEKEMPRCVVNRLKLFLLFVFSGLIDKRCLEFKHLTEIDKCMIF